MQIVATAPPFAWRALEDSPSIKAIREFLALVPDARLLEALRRWRGRGRDDYPVAVLWGVSLLTVLLRHSSIEACLAELRRNPSLRKLIGIEAEENVPKKWSISRFQQVLGQQPHRTLLREVFDTLIRRLGTVVGDLGRRTAGDASGLDARRTKHKTGRRSASGTVSEDDLPEPAGGRKEYTDDAGRATHVVEWFGYKFHLLVDVKHEVILAWRISSTRTGDNQVLPELLEQAQANSPAGRIETLAYDKACDDAETHRLLHREKIKPLIENRSLWTGEHERLLPGHDGNSNIVHDEGGTVYCYDKISRVPVRHKMSYIGHEPRRGTLKYRCPAKHQGWRCPSEKRCNAGRKYGLTVRVRREIDLRRFPPIPRATRQFERLYKDRTAVERVNARVKILWGADDGNTVGPQRFFAQLGTIMVVHAGLATLLARPLYLQPRPHPAPEPKDSGQPAPRRLNSATKPANLRQNDQNHARHTSKQRNRLREIVPTRPRGGRCSFASPGIRPGRADSVRKPTRGWENGLRYRARPVLIVIIRTTGAGYHAAAPLPFGPNTPVVAACSVFARYAYRRNIPGRFRPPGFSPRRT